MDSKIKILHDQIEQVKLTLGTTTEVLSKLLDYQISLENQLQDLIQLNSNPTISIRSAKQIDFIPVNEILYCSASLSYTEIITERHNTIVASKSISEFEDNLRKYNFYKISKSTLINVQKIHSYNRKNNLVIMKNEATLEVARRRKTDFFIGYNDRLTPLKRKMNHPLT